MTRIVYNYTFKAYLGPSLHLLDSSLTVDWATRESVNEILMDPKSRCTPMASCIEQVVSGSAVYFNVMSTEYIYCNSHIDYKGRFVYKTSLLLVQDKFTLMNAVVNDMKVTKQCRLKMARKSSRDIALSWVLTADNRALSEELNRA